MPELPRFEGPYELPDGKLEPTFKPRNDVIDIYHRLSDADSKAKTEELLDALEMNRAFSAVLSHEEMQTLRLGVNVGHTLDINPPIYTASVFVSLYKDGRRIMLEDRLQWQPTQKSIPVSPALLRESISMHGTHDKADETIDGIPRHLIANTVRAMLSRIKNGQLAEKPVNWDGDLRNQLLIPNLSGATHQEEPISGTRPERSTMTHRRKGQFLNEFIRFIMRIFNVRK